MKWTISSDKWRSKYGQLIKRHGLCTTVTGVQQRMDNSLRVQEGSLAGFEADRNEGSV